MRFFEAGEGHSGVSRRPPADVPPVVFSEVLRDVDFFVSITTVANDASFRESQLEGRADEAWQSLTWGELGSVVKARAELIERVLARTILRGRARVEERWVIVDGSTERFRIHLGSTGVIRERDQQAVPVAADRQAREQAARAFLPFEGDSLLGGCWPRRSSSPARGRRPTTPSAEVDQARRSRGEQPVIAAQ